MERTKKMTKAEFFEVLKKAGEPDKCFEDVLNTIGCFCWNEVRQAEKEGKEGLAKAYRDEAKKIHEALDARGYFDDVK